MNLYGTRECETPSTFLQRGLLLRRMRKIESEPTDPKAFTDARLNPYGKITTKNKTKTKKTKTKKTNQREWRAGEINRAAPRQPA